MRRVSQPVKRPYRSRKREAGAAATRERIRQAAAELFTEQGYTATSLRQVAERAGVAERTLYTRFDSKLELLRHVINVLTVGDEQRIPVRDRPGVVAARETEDPREALARWVAEGAALMERAGDVIMVAYEVSGSDPELGDLVRRGITSTHGIHLGLTEMLAARGQLRPGLDAVAAADILYALGSPATHHALRRERGWTAARYQAWLTDAAVQQLLPPDAPPGDP